MSQPQSEDYDETGPAPTSFRGFRRLIDGLLPHACFSCDRQLKEGPGLCPSCWSNIDFIEAPLCSCCGRPFEIDPFDGLLCAKCIAEPPLFKRARASFIYNGQSRGLVTGFKYADRTDFAPAYGQWLERAGVGFLDDVDLIIPVPLHPLRLFVRKYNQAGLLAARLSKETLIPVLHDGLKRLRNTKQQVGLSRAKRRRNVQGAFRVKPKYASQLEGAHVVLIDDVITSGATISACARALGPMKPREISVLTLARTLE